MSFELKLVLINGVFLFCRPPIPNSITEEVRRKLPNSTFTSNPCRIQYCTQEIVVFREDIVTKMCRNCVKFPADNDVPTHVSLLTQLSQPQVLMFLLFVIRGWHLIYICGLQAKFLKGLKKNICSILSYFLQSFYKFDINILIGQIKATIFYVGKNMRLELTWCC